MGGQGILDILYWTMLSLLLAHELDAVRAEEWRVLPLTGFLPDRIGQTAFVLLHVPLFVAILATAGAGAASPGRIALAAFCILHVGLHWLYRRHPLYRFRGAVSNALIGLPGLLGLAYLALVRAA